MRPQLTPELPVDPFSPPRLLKRAIATIDWPTVALFVGCWGLWAGALVMPAGWGALGFVGLLTSLTLHSSLSHEILHGHPFRNKTANSLLGLVQPGLMVPYFRFKRLHLAHHRDETLTDPYEDPESNYLDPARWGRLSAGTRVMLLFNNTLFGRMLIGPIIGMSGFIRGDIARFQQGDRQVAWDWAVHLPGIMMVLWVVSLTAVPIWVYLLACYAALSVLRIRTFLEHRAHAQGQARTVIVEDRGLLAFLFLNNNLHVVHHMHPGVCWYDLPRLYRAHRDRFLARNDGYVYRSYGEVFRRYFLSRKDPVAHPLWPRD